jgi:SMI1-KNR4 cell-wall
MTVATLKKFISAWVHPDYGPIPVTQEALDRAEARLDTYLPRSYRRCMIEVGPPGTALSLLTTIVDRRLDLPSIGDFLSPEDVMSTTEDWREAGLPENMVAFATSGGGDLYCFEVVPEGAAVPEDATVWYFDHEERETESLNLNFSEWLALYANISNPPSFADA